MNVPIILVAGDAQLIKDDVINHDPWAETLALKHFMGKVSVKNSSMKTIEKELREEVKKAAKGLKQNRANCSNPKSR